MNKERVIKRALRKAGYDINSRGFETSTINKTAKEILDEIVIDIQKETGLRNNIRWAVLTEVKNVKSNYLDDVIKSHPDCKIYKMPEDFIEYIGSTRSADRAVILGGFLVVIPKNRYSVFLDDNPFSMEYRYKQQLENMPEILETYASLKLAYELTIILKADDGNRIRMIRIDMVEELASLRSLQNIELGLANQNTIGGSNLKWRY